VTKVILVAPAPKEFKEHRVVKDLVAFLALEE
jgi:hypothetical protein